MKKKLIAFLLIICVLSTTAIPAFAAEEVIVAASPVAITVTLNEGGAVFDAYDISGNIHFKLRDLAFVLSDTEKRFDVEWDSVNNAISLVSGRQYTIVGGEMIGKGTGDKAVSPTESIIYLDGEQVRLVAYHIEGNNYFKLRDIGRAFNFDVQRDRLEQTFAIDTGVEYVVADMPGDFNFKIDFGTFGKNNIDTYNNTFKKDLIYSGTETIDFEIPAEKMLEIYEAFLEYEISDLPEDINADAESSFGDTVVQTTPYNAYSLTYTCNEETRTIVCNDGGPWDAELGAPDSRNRLVAFVAFVVEWIYSTNDYKEMPPAEGGYL